MYIVLTALCNKLCIEICRFTKIILREKSSLTGYVLRDDTKGGYFMDLSLSTIWTHV